MNDRMERSASSPAQDGQPVKRDHDQDAEQDVPRARAAHDHQRLVHKERHHQNVHDSRQPKLGRRQRVKEVRHLS